MLHIGKCSARPIVFVLRGRKGGSQLARINNPELSQDWVSKQSLEIGPLTLGRPREEPEQDALANPSSHSVRQDPAHRLPEDPLALVGPNRELRREP